MQSGTSETRLGSSPSRPLDTMNFAPGTVLADRYRIIALVGRGGMGEVFRADDLRLGQPVALKFLPVTLERDETARDRLLAEVRSARTVSHPNVCRVYDVGEVEGRFFLTMEYIDGEDLASLLRRIGRLPGGKALEIARQLCAGLAAAHERGVLHRDLKPANVMIDGRGQARITDFGLAVELEAARTPAPRGAVDVAGTVAYMAPERFEGRPATVQSDLYALGLVLYEIYTGKQAMTATTIEGWRRAHGDSQPSDPSTIVAEIDRAVEHAILRCLEKDPTKRPASAAHLAASLPGGDPLAAALARGETPSPELVAAAGTTGLVKPARALLLLAATIAALVGCVIVAGYIHPVRIAPMNASPDVLADRARQVVQAFGYAEAAADSSAGFRVSTGLYQMLREPWAESRKHLAAGQPPAFLFWYRQSPRLLETLDFGTGGRVSPNDPPRTAPGMIEVSLDAAARLVRFIAVPSETGADAAAVADPDWSIGFAKAGFDITRFTAAASTRRPPVYADVRKAWDGVYPNAPDVKIHIEAAAVAGRLVYLDVLNPWDRPDTAAMLSRSRAVFTNVLLAVIFGALPLAAVVVGLRNLRLGRGDRRGAFRLAGLLLVTAVASSLLGADLHAETIPLIDVVGLALAQGLTLSAVFWLAYMAFEPYVRRRWPQVLIAWARLVGGHWHDPLVARDILIGVMVGAALQTTQVLGLASPTALSYVPRVWPLDGFRFAMSWLATNLSLAVGKGLQAVLLLFFLTLLLRRRWVSALIVALYLAVSGALVSPASLLVGILLNGLAAGILLALLLRFGLVALVAALFAGAVLGDYPLTFDVSQWYAAGSYLTLGVLVALAGFGAWTSANLRSVIPRWLGEAD